MDGATTRPRDLFEARLNCAQGQPRRSKLNPYRYYLPGLIEATLDLTIRELRERLVTDRGVNVSRATELSRFR